MTVGLDVVRYRMTKPVLFLSQGIRAAPTFNQRERRARGNMVEVFCYQHNIGNYDDATRGFSLIQHGAYLRLIQLYYKSVGRLPSDIKLLCRMLSCQSKAERDAVAYAVAEKFTVGEDGFLRNSGAENELQRITKVSEENRRKANIKWLKEKERRNAAAMPDGMPKGCPDDANLSTYQYNNIKLDTESETKNQKRKDISPFEASITFEDFWQNYPKQTRRGFALEAYRKALSITDHKTIMVGLNGYVFPQEQKFCPKPEDWLKGECWIEGLKNNTSDQTLTEDQKREAYFLKNGKWLSIWGDVPDHLKKAV